MFYTDDGNLVGNAEDVKTAIMVLVKGFAQIGLSMHFGKSVYYDGQPVAEVGETERMGYLDDDTSRELRGPRSLEGRLARMRISRPQSPRHSPSTHEALMSLESYRRMWQFCY
jgi:hypothetical protein